MEWLKDIGKQTRRSLAQAAQHTSGLMEHVGTAVDTVALAADSLMPSQLDEVKAELAGHPQQPIADESRGAEHINGDGTGRAARSAQGPSDGPSRKSLRAVQVPASSLVELTATVNSGARGDEAWRERSEREEEDEEPITYAAADEGADDPVQAAPMSRGLLGLGMSKHPRCVSHSRTPCAPPM
jgi:hypothetical protein